MNGYMNELDNHMSVCKKRKYNLTTTEQKNEVSSGRLLLLTPSPFLYHAEGVISLPYDAKKAREETLYLPMADTIFINVKVYDEVLVRNGMYFLADSCGMYDRTVEGVTFNFLKYDQNENKMCTARSFLCIGSEKANEISDFLMQF